MALVIQEVVPPVAQRASKLSRRKTTLKVTHRASQENPDPVQALVL